MINRKAFDYDFTKTLLKKFGYGIFKASWDELVDLLGLQMHIVKYHINKFEKEGFLRVIEKSRTSASPNLIEILKIENRDEAIEIYSVDEDIKENKEILNDAEYISKVDEIKEYDIYSVTDCNTIPKSRKEGSSIVYSRDPQVGKLAIINANYLCEYDNSHTTFVSQISGKPFMEAHHIIPFPKQQEIWNKYGVNIDCLENIVSLCPTCHRAIHYSKRKQREQMVKKLFHKKIDEWKKRGITFKQEDIFDYF